MEKTAPSLLNAALKAYGIDKKYVLASHESDGIVTCVTHGGTRVTYSKNMENISKLSDVEITGFHGKEKKKKN